MSGVDYDTEQRQYDDEARYDRDRSRSPRIDRRDDNGRARSASPDGRNRMDDDERPPPQPVDDDDDPAAINPGSNLFVTGIHPRLSEDDVARLFEKYGTVKGCNVMRDPHTRESRGFGFVDMSSSEEADAAKNGLQGETIEGRTLSIEKARRSKPRTPTPGKYFGPPKRDDFRRRRGGYGGGGSYGGDRYDDRRGGGGYGRRDDYGRPPRYDDRYDDRGYGGRRRDERRYPDVDRYASRDEGYGGSYDRRGGGGRGGYGGYGRDGGHGRDDGRGGSYGEYPPSRGAYGGGRNDDRNYDRI